MSSSPPEKPGSATAPRGSVVRNFLALGSGEALSRAVAFGAYVYLARALGAQGYGVISFAAGLNLYLAKLADFAIEAVGSKEVARAPETIPFLASAMLTARLGLTLVLTGVSSALVLSTMPEPERTVLCLFFLTLLPIAASTKWVHMGLENALPVGVWRVVGELLMLALVVGLVRDMGDLWIVPLAILAGDSLAATALYLKLRRDGYPFGLRWDPQTALPMFKKAAPLMGQIITGLLLYNMDLIFLRVMRDSETVGYYAAAYMLISFLANLGMTYAMTLLPALARQGERSPEERALYHTSQAQVFAVTLPIAVGGTFVAPGIIALGFGADYEQSVLVLQILVWTIPPVVYRAVPWSALIVRGKQSLLLRATIFAVVANAVLNLVLIDRYGILGAAIATVVTEPIVGAFMLYYAARDDLSPVGFARLWRPAAAAVGMAGALQLLGDANLFIQLPVGGLVYLALMAALGAIGREGSLPVLRV